MPMIDLHTHTIFSDGELIPSELARRAVANGYRGLAITDHADPSNMDFIVPRIVGVCAVLSEQSGITVVPGIELTHIPPALIPSLIREARKMGARLVVVHGETLVEPVAEGTNLAAIQGGADILAHPGLISEQEVALAAKHNVFLEITARKGHSLANGHVARLATHAGASMVLNTDAHAPQDLITQSFSRRVAAGAGLLDAQIDTLFANSEALLSRVMLR